MDSPQSWNRYSYVYNNPILHNDPTGHAPSCDNGDWDGCKSKIVIFFGGSYPTDINKAGPSPFTQSLLWTTDQNGTSVNTVPYPGTQYYEKDDGRPYMVSGKTQQAKNARGLLSNENVDLIAYSAGTESALMYAQWRIKHGQGVNSIALLGPTFESSSMTFDTPGGGWSGVMDDLISQGVNIFVLDDGDRIDQNAKNYKPPKGSNYGNYTYKHDPIEHYSTHPDFPFGWGWFQGTNNSPRIKKDVYSWLANPQ